MAAIERHRHKGDGYRRDDGLWVIRVQLADGKRVACYGKTLAEARRKAEAKRGEWRPAAEASVASFAQDWLSERRTSMKPQGWATYERTLRLHILPVLGDVRAQSRDGDSRLRLHGCGHGPVPIPLRVRDLRTGNASDSALQCDRSPHRGLDLAAGSRSDAE